MIDSLFFRRSVRQRLQSGPAGPNLRRFHANYTLMEFLTFL